LNGGGAATTSISKTRLVNRPDLRASWLFERLAPIILIPFILFIRAAVFERLENITVDLRTFAPQTDPPADNRV
jgi:hypothetical protein